MTGSEGLLGVVTEVTVRILQKPETARAVLVGFPTSEDAGQCVADIIAAGIIPGGMEMMDRPAIHAAEEFVHAGYPLDVEALLIVELDGPQVEVDHLIARVVGDRHGQPARTTLRISTSEAERLLFWAGRKAAFPAVGPHLAGLYLHGRHHPAASACRRCCSGMAELSAQARPARRQCLPCRRRQSASADPLRCQRPGRAGHAPRSSAPTSCRLCVKVGGVLTGEHGVGIEKRDLMPEMFTEVDLDQQKRVKCAFDAKGLLNPGKVFPTLHRCAELGRMHVKGGAAALPGYSEVLMADVVEARQRRRTVGDHPLGRRPRSRSSAPAPSAGLAARCRRRPTLDMSGFSGIIAL